MSPAARSDNDGGVLSCSARIAAALASAYGVDPGEIASGGASDAG